MFSKNSLTTPLKRYTKEKEAMSVASRQKNSLQHPPYSRTSNHHTAADVKERV